MNEWIAVCKENDLIPNSGVAALVNGEQIAVFYIPQATPSFYAIGNYDPIGKANVLSRGLICSFGEDIYVASPLYKEHYNLVTGECLEQPDYKVSSWQCELRDGSLFVQKQTNFEYTKKSA